MPKHADKSHNNQIRAVAQQLEPKRGSSEATFSFVDNRQEAIAQRKLQERMNNSPQVQQSAQLPTRISQSALAVAQQQQMAGLSGQTAQRQGMPEEDELQLKPEAAPLQRQSKDEEELLQGKSTIGDTPSQLQDEVSPSLAIETVPQNYGAAVSGLEEEFLSILEEVPVGFDAESEGISLSRSENSVQQKAVITQRVYVIQLQLNFRQARDFLRRVLRLANRWQSIYRDLSELIDRISAMGNERISSTNLTTIVRALRDQFEGDEEMTSILVRIQEMVNDLEDLAGRIDSLAGDVFRNLNSTVSDDERDALDAIFESIQDGISQE